jgi:hypothetical protein
LFSASSAIVSDGAVLVALRDRPVRRAGRTAKAVHGPGDDRADRASASARARHSCKPRRSAVVQRACNFLQLAADDRVGDGRGGRGELLLE